MRIIRWIVAAFSMYSKIPVPNCINDDDSAHAIFFLPLVGAVIGALVYGADVAMRALSFPVYAKVPVYILIPIIVTGGFHIDGFLDTADALASYRSREKKLEILKDPHVGSFAVIRLGALALILMSALFVILDRTDDNTYPVIAAGSAVFVISRALAALTSFAIKKARGDGMLAGETAYRKSGMAASFVWLALSAAFVIAVDMNQACFELASFAVFTLYYGLMVNKNFGGVTGDTAGYYVTVSEVFAAVALALAVII